MKYIVKITAISLMFFPSYVLCHPWILETGKYEFTLSSKVFFYGSESTVKLQEPHEILLSSYLEKLRYTSSRREKQRLQTIIDCLQDWSYDSDLYKQYFNIEYGIYDSLDLGLESIFSIANLNQSRIVKKLRLSPYIKYQLFNLERFSGAISSKLNNDLSESTDSFLDFGISWGYKKNWKKNYKYFTYYEFNFSPKQYLKFTGSQGVEAFDGWVFLLSTSYFNEITDFKNLHSEKIIFDFFIEKKISSFFGSEVGGSIFIKYSNEYSKYVNSNISYSIECGICLK
jgi:hypothetical protein